MIVRRLLKATSEYLKKAQNPWPEKQRMLYQFGNQEELTMWNVFSDSQLGGKSTAAIQPSSDTPSAAEFSGMYSREVNDDASTRLKRSGFAGISVRAPQGEYLDLDDFHSLVFRVKGDGRKYLANIRTDNWIVGESTDDVWQAFLFARAGEWSEVEIPLNRFLMTWRGKVLEQQVEMHPGRITGLGISLAGGDDLQPEGPYALGIEWIAARNHAVIVSNED
ncbi:hypothetical protein Ndes2526B_g01456 [Nannochloris sp. 'desiccata']